VIDDLLKIYRCEHNQKPLEDYVAAAQEYMRAAVATEMCARTGLKNNRANWYSSARVALEKATEALNTDLVAKGSELSVSAEDAMQMLVKLFDERIGGGGGRYIFTEDEHCDRRAHYKCRCGAMIEIIDY